MKKKARRSLEEARSNLGTVVLVATVAWVAIAFVAAKTTDRIDKAIGKDES